jgi:hypothetical protein
MRCIYLQKGCKKLSKQMAMQSNCSGSSRDLRAKRIVRGRPGAERGGREYFKFLKAPTRTGKCGALNCQVGEEKDRPLLGFYVSIFYEKWFLVRSFLVMTCSQIWSLPHCLTQPKLGSIVHSHCLPPPYLQLLVTKLVSCHHQTTPFYSTSEFLV